MAAENALLWDEGALASQQFEDALEVNIQDKYNECI